MGPRSTFRPSVLAHPLIRTLLSQPELVVEHAGAYVELAGAELGEVGRRLRLRWAMLLCAGVAVVLTLMLAAAALLALCIVPVERMPWPWGLAALPGATLLLGAVCLVASRRIVAPLDFPMLREQWEVDRRILSTARKL